MDSFSTTILDISIADAITKKKNVDMKMDSIMRLMGEVELREKAAEKAKQEVDDCSLDIHAEIDELIVAQQHAKETNDKHTREVYAQKAGLAIQMKELLSCVSGVLNQGDGCLAAIEEMYKSLEKRLTSAVKRKEAADKEKLEKEAELAYQRNQMEKLVEESKKLEKQAMENLKLLEFITDNGDVINMLQEEMHNKCQEVKLLKEGLKDYQDERARNGPKLKGQMEKLVEESESQEQEAMDNLQLQEFLTDHGHVGNMIQEGISCNSEDVKLPKEKLEDSKDESRIEVVEDYSMPMIEETIPREDCECYKCYSTSNGVIVASREGMRANKNVKSRMNDSERIQELADSYTEQLDKRKRTRR